MTLQPQRSLHRVLDDLGATLLELVCAPSSSRADPDEIGGVAIHDPVDEPALPRRALVLGVGVHTPADIAALLTSLAAHAAAGLVVRSPVSVDPSVAAAVEASGVPLLALTRGASWTQLAALLRSLLAEGDVGDPGSETLGGLPSGDLFSVANAVAALIDAPVTIEDRSSRVLAFSGRQDEADRSRVETILGRQVPERYSRHLVERGVFRELYRSEQPVYIEPPSDAGMADFALQEFSLPRAAVAVRAGDEVLGSIWAAVREPLTPDRAQAMCDAARLVALHLLRIRAGADVSRRLRADLVSTALEGGTGAFEAVRRLGLADQPVVVVALAVADPAERARLADGLAMHLSAIHPRCAAALVGDVAYGLIPVVSSGSPGADGATSPPRTATGRQARWRGCRPTTLSTARTWSRHCAPGWTPSATWQRLRRRCSCTRTPSATGSGGSPRSAASTWPTPNSASPRCSSCGPSTRAGGRGYRVGSVGPVMAALAVENYRSPRWPGRAVCRRRCGRGQRRSGGRARRHLPRAGCRTLHAAPPETVAGQLPAGPARSARV